MPSNSGAISRGREHDAVLNESGALHALTVDDDPITLQIASHKLEAIGLRVDQADSGHAAMRCLDGQSYDLVLTDLQMPEMDGYELAGRLKHQSRHIKVIIMTGCASQEVDQYMQSDIVDSWLFKPFSLSALKKLVVAVFNGNGVPAK